MYNAPDGYIIDEIIINQVPSGVRWSMVPNISISVGTKKVNSKAIQFSGIAENFSGFLRYQLKFVKE